MKSNERIAKIVIMALIFVACHPTGNDSNRGELNYEIAPLVYIALTEKSLDYLASFEFESFAEMLTDSVEYELPDGEKIIGKTTLINYWKNYKIINDIYSMKITNANYLPLHTRKKLQESDFSGVKVVADFTNSMILCNKQIAVKMNFNFYFNKQKLINRINSNYDQTLINKGNNKVF
jgi:hypothetical protein